MAPWYLQGNKISSHWFLTKQDLHPSLDPLCSHGNEVLWLQLAKWMRPKHVWILTHGQTHDVTTHGRLPRIRRLAVTFRVFGRKIEIPCEKATSGMVYRGSGPPSPSLPKKVPSHCFQKRAFLGLEGSRQNPEDACPESRVYGKVLQ